MAALEGGDVATVSYLPPAFRLADFSPNVARQCLWLWHNTQGAADALRQTASRADVKPRASLLFAGTRLMRRCRLAEAMRSRPRRANPWSIADNDVYISETPGAEGFQHQQHVAQRWLRADAKTGAALGIIVRSGCLRQRPMAAGQGAEIEMRAGRGFPHKKATSPFPSMLCCQRRCPDGKFNRLRPFLWRGAAWTLGPSCLHCGSVNSACWLCQRQRRRWPIKKCIAFGRKSSRRNRPFLVNKQLGSFPRRIFQPIR